MLLRHALAVTLGFLTFLSSLMLGLGQGDASLPIMMGMAATISFFLTDYKRVLELGEWTANVLVVLIFAFNVIDVVQQRGEDLAWSIARVLVFVQIVLLFREKNIRFCWQIMFISLLQVVVATVFHQSITFAALLLLYVFVGLCTFILLFLQQEHRYFRQHSFVRTFSETIKTEMAERQDRRKLARIALMTLLIGPLSLVLTFDKKNDKKKSTQQSNNQKTPTQEMLRKLFLIFPTEEDIAQKERWERVEENISSAVCESAKTQREDAISFHAVPNRGKNDSSFVYRRFTLLTERPSFSAGTQSPHPWNGNWQELFTHLIAGTSFALVFAIIIFCLVPRVGRIEFSNYTFKQEFERWIQPVQQHINVGIVGMSEDIQLGSLGSVIPHHREVIKVRFLRYSNFAHFAEPDYEEDAYQAITGATLYFRGTPLETYFEGSWTLQRPAVPFGENQANPILSVPSLGSPFQSWSPQQAVFESGGDLVTLVMTIQPLGTQVFFAPHPFFDLRKQEEIELRSVNGRSEETQRRRRERTKTIVSSAFKHGVQLDLTPCQEWINYDNLLQVPDEGLDALKALAVQWDSESGLSNDDIIGRARFMEQKFLQSPDFAYQLGGTLRDYDLDPLEDFIMNNPRGHCEYFAGALVLMLRSVGIGSRIILGFKTEAADANASCTIRQSDAHAWVEVYIPPETMPERTAGEYAAWWQNGGWLRLDPTPASDDATLMSALSLRWTDMSQFVQSLWEEYVLNMTSGKQTDLIYAPLYQAGHFIVYRVFNFEFWKEFGSDMMLYYMSFFSNAPQQERRMGDGYYLLPPFIILALLGLACWRLKLMLQSTRKRAVEEMRRKITIEFYLRMERILAKVGLIRGAALTPLEFARQTSYMPLMLPIVNAFYRVRFGNVVLSDEESLSIMKTLEQLESAAVLAEAQ